MSPLLMCTTAHERVDVVAFRKDYVSHWGTIKHRVVRGSGPEVEALLGKPYEYRFSPEEQAVLKVTLHDKPDGTQERPLLVRWQAASHHGPSPITFQIVEVFPLDATSMCSQVIFHDEATVLSSDFYTKQRWGRLGEPVTSSKTSVGQGVMLTGWLASIGLVFSEIFDVHTEHSYWTSERMVKHTDRMLDVVGPRYPAADLLFIFDNSTNHKKFADTAPAACKMNVNPGGKRTRVSVGDIGINDHPVHRVATA